MDLTSASRELVTLFLRMVQRYNAMEKLPVQHDAALSLYHSERHLLDIIGDRPSLNVSELAAAVGVTKGAISQMLKKLENKGVVQRYKKSTNEKEVFVELSKAGKTFHEKHRLINAETEQVLSRELAHHPEAQVEFLLEMFRWLDTYLAQSQERMRTHSQKRE